MIASPRHQRLSGPSREIAKCRCGALSEARYSTPVHRLSTATVDNRSPQIPFPTIFTFSKTDFARTYEYCKYGPESPSKEIDLSKSKIMSPPIACRKMEYFMAPIATFSDKMIMFAVPLHFENPHVPIVPKAKDDYYRCEVF